jgi:hypothetical protein
MTDLKEQFERDGCLVIPDFLTSEEVEAALADAYAIAEVIEPTHGAEERDFFGVFSFRANNARVLERPGLAAIQNKPELGEMARLLVGEAAAPTSQLIQIYMPHAGHKQAWHTDSDPGDAPFLYVTFVTYLQEQTLATGCTRVVPGSHRTPIEKRLPDHDDLPGQLAVEGPAGTLCVFGSNTWHSGAENHSDQPRFVLALRFCKPEFLYDNSPHGYGRARFARGMRRSGTPIFDHPTEEGSYEWPEAYDLDKMPYRTS